MHNNPFEKIDKNNAVLLVADHQVGLFHVVRDYTPEEFKTNIIAHAAIGKAFNLPTILTTLAENGPNGPLVKEVQEMHPNAPLIKRLGEVNPWDCPEFRHAVEATGKKQVILGGIVTDVCVLSLALSLRQAGYSVFANAEASGTTTRRIADDANERMRTAGVHVCSMFSIAADFMKDWRGTPGAAELGPLVAKFLPIYGFVSHGHLAAVKAGVVQPGQEG